MHLALSLSMAFGYFVEKACHVLGPEGHFDSAIVTCVMPFGKTSFHKLLLLRYRWQYRVELDKCY